MKWLRTRGRPWSGCGAGRAAGSGGRESASGFTLVEALVALVLLGVAIVGIIEALAGGLRAEAGLDRHLAAVALAEHRMTALARLPADSLLRYREARGGAFPPPFDDFRWRALVRPSGDRQDLLGAAVRVEWADGDFTIETVLYRPEPLPPALRSGR